MGCQLIVCPGSPGISWLCLGKVELAEHVSAMRFVFSEPVSHQGKYRLLIDRLLWGEVLPIYRV